MNEIKKKLEADQRIIAQLKGRVRKHRPAEKVIEMSCLMAEDQIERVERQLKEMKRSLDYMSKLKPKDLEQEEEEKS